MFLSSFLNNLIRHEEGGDLFFVVANQINYNYFDLIFRVVDQW